MPTKYYTIAELLTKLRKTQTEFAQEMDVKFQTVNKWCNGRAKPATRHCRIIEERYGVQLIYRRGGKNGTTK